MENASKALLIAGAVLVVILIIGVGMLIYTSATGAIQEGVNRMSVQEQNMFNQQFEQYVGSRINGSNVRALLQNIRNSNNQNADVPTKQVKVTGVVTSKTENNIQTISGTDITGINTANSYTVTADDTDNDGLIDTVSITRNGGTR